ncbi:MAG: iron-siderophore ABC transporter substrate-binding protein [Miltoncostaeaceae bacterium]
MVRRRSWWGALVAALAVGTLLAGCGGDDEGAGTATGAATGSTAGPVTIAHAFGETVIEGEPERVVAWGWASADAAIALGVTPVAIPFQSYGGDEEGVLPWIREALTSSGDPMPAVLPDSGEEPPYEEIAAAEPDLILAPYSGVTREQYDLLSEIAPTVAYPEEAWATPWRETIRIVGTALGREADAEALLADIDARLAAQAAEHPELEGKSVAMVWDSAGTFYVYRPADARVEATEALGLVSDPSVEELANGDSTFFYTLSQEEVDGIESDILVSFADSEELSREFLSSAHGRTMDQVRRGAVAEVVGTEFIAAVSPPTALSLTWGLDEYVELLSGAARAADAS